MNSKPYQLLFVISFLLLTSCVSYDELVYLQSDEEGTMESITPPAGSDSIDVKGLAGYKLKPSDNLFISINSFQETTNEFLNQSGDQSMMNATTASQLYLSSYSVNDSGYIRLPLLGSVYVNGLTLEEVQDKLVVDIASIIREPSVSVKLANFRVTILGEVNAPGSINIYDDKITLIEALGLSGGLTDYANMKKIKIVRKNEDKYISEYIDMSSADVIYSEYFYILPDDVIYVEPLKAKSFSLNIRPISLLLGIASITTTLLATLVLTSNN